MAHMGKLIPVAFDLVSVVLWFSFVCCVLGDANSKEESCQLLSSTSCKCKTSHQTYDLGLLIPHDISVSAKDKARPDVFYYNPCNTLSQPNQCKDYLFCQNDQTLYYPLARPLEGINMVWLSQEKTLIVNYTADFQSHTRHATVKFMCKSDETKGRFVFLDENPPTFYIFNYLSNHSALCSSGGGLSTGSILLIIFFVGIVVYLCVGILLKHFIAHAQGSELIPNREFWGSLPGLIKDGWCFVIRCGQAESTYDQI